MISATLGLLVVGVLAGARPGVLGTLNMLLSEFDIAKYHGAALHRRPEA